LIIPDELVIEVGTAVEKAGFWVDALTYYEDAEASVRTDELRHKCAERWIKAKERHAEITPENDTVTRDKRNKEAVNKRMAYDIPESTELLEYEELPEWAELYHFVVKNESVLKNQENTGEPKAIAGGKQSTPKVKVLTVKKSPVKIAASESLQSQSNIKEFERYGYRFTYYYRQKRLNITNIAEGRVISITRNNHSSDDYKVKEVTLEDGKYKSIKGTPILFQNAEKILVKFSDTGFKLDFDE